jgi:hypothetical protein
VVVAAEPQDVPGQEEGRAGPPAGAEVRVPGVGHLVEELAGELADAAGQKQFPAARGRGPERVVGGEQAELVADRPDREP